MNYPTEMQNAMNQYPQSTNTAYQGLLGRSSSISGAGVTGAIAAASPISGLLQSIIGELSGLHGEFSDLESKIAPFRAVMPDQLPAKGTDEIAPSPVESELQLIHRSLVQLAERIRKARAEVRI